MTSNISEQNKAQTGNEPAKAGDASPKKPDQALAERPDSNVDQDGHCLTAAYAEAVDLNTGAPCDDGRAGVAPAKK